MSVITPWGVGVGFPYSSSLDEGQSPTDVILCLVYCYILGPHLSPLSNLAGNFSKGRGGQSAAGTMGQGSYGKVQV